MAIPDYQSLMRPVLAAMGKGEPCRIPEIRERVALDLKLPESELRELTPSGQKPLYHDRIAWALTYLKHAGALSQPKRGVYQITSRGRALLEDYPDRVDNVVLGRFQEFRDFMTRAVTGASAKGVTEEEKEGDGGTDTPEESLETAFRRVRSAIEAELLDQVKSASPEFFERLVVELLVSMGYGGSLKDAGQAIGKAGDEGIDGIIKEDRLGLDVIQVQAKKWTDRTVGRPDVQAFAGSLEGVRARKGILLTTSSFSREARDYVERIDKRIVLIDGEELAGLMYEHGIGVTPTANYAVKRVDSDYFGEE